MAKRIYICGNESVKEDNMPFRFLDQLSNDFPEIDFVVFDPTENFPVDDPLYIVDVIMGAGKVVVIDDVEKIADAPRVSVHDADLAFHLKWLKKVGELPAFVIFGVPEEGNEKSILKDLESRLREVITA